MSVPSGSSAEDERRETPQELAQRWRRESDEHDNRMASDILLLCALELESVLASRAPAGEPDEESPDEGELLVALHLAWLARFLEAQAEQYDEVSARAFRASAKVARLLADPDNATCVPGRAETILRDTVAAGAAPDGRANDELDGAWLRAMADEANLTEKQSADLVVIAAKLDTLANRSAWKKGLGATP